MAIDKKKSVSKDDDKSNLRSTKGDSSRSKLTAAGQLQAIIETLKKHTTTAVLLLIGGGMIYTFITIASAIQETNDPAYHQKQSEDRVRSSFDRDTIEKINQLRSRDDSGSVDLPSGRINPFTE